MTTHKGERHHLSQYAIGHSGDGKGIGILFTREDKETFNVLMDWKQVERLIKSLHSMMEIPYLRELEHTRSLPFQK